ncbi:MAG: cupredoxin domain-containing protein [Coriobacteriia bacterium]|nr:cupredoxin domain-containing protein [Coriobacteriia bacterium]
MASQTTTSGTARYVIIAIVIVTAFFGAYRFASARSVQAADAASSQGLTPAATATDPSATPGCACCGSTAPTANGITGDPVEGVATVDGSVQRIEIDLSKGYYDPNVIVLEAGVPAEITFGQSSGCTAQVMSKDLNFFEDLTAGPVTVKLAALDAGEYTFACGMEMVFGKIVVR